MILYHGSPVQVPKPDVFHSRKKLDFGAGFYTTSYRDQACRWADRFARRGKPAILNSYRFDETVLTQARVLRFDDYDEPWLDFVTACRSGIDTVDYDIIIGGVANDRVFDTCTLYFEGLIRKEDALGRLAMEEPNVQYCFKEQSLIDASLLFLESEEL